MLFETTFRQTSLSFKPGAPNENIVQNHLNMHSIVKRILVFKR